MLRGNRYIGALLAYGSPNIGEIVAHVATLLCNLECISDLRKKWFVH